MKYPLQSHESGGFYPRSGKCGFCGASNEGHFVALSFSAMERISSNSLVPAQVETSFSLLDHGVTKSGKALTVFQNTNDAYFCSSNCLRQFFNQIVTDFESASFATVIRMNH